MIYIHKLFQTDSIKFILYIDDIALVVSSGSFSKNITILEREVKRLYELGAWNTIKFDLTKTELIHFGDSNISIKLPDDTIVAPKLLVKWLGIWFDYKLTYKQYMDKKVSKAYSTLQRMTRIVNISRGLSPTATRQLYLACIVSIVDYGSVI